MSIEIVGATLRDLSYIACNLRPEDEAEVAAQFDKWSPSWLAAISLRDFAYCVEMAGNPEAAFGVGEVRRGQWIAWSWTTRHGVRAIPRITRFVRKVIITDIFHSGGQRVEARCLATNATALRWLPKLGAHHCATLRNYGTNGESFELFEWCRCDYEEQFAIRSRPVEEVELPDAA